MKVHFKILMQFAENITARTIENINARFVIMHRAHMCSVLALPFPVQGPSLDVRI